MAFSVNSFKSAIRTGGARSSLFEVLVTNPANGTSDTNFPLFCLAGSIPAMKINKLNLSYFGRNVPVAGNRDWDDWTVTFYNDEDFAIRDAMETWSNYINGFESNVRKFGTSLMTEYKSSAQVIQYSQTGAVLRTYQVIGIFPTNISEQELAWGEETIQTVKVTFAVDYWQVIQSSTGSQAGGT
jgi:hypothetical protein